MKEPSENLPKTKKPLKRGVKLIITYCVIVVAVIAILAVVFAIIFKKKKPYVPPPPAVEVIKPSMRTINQSVKISGYIEAKDMIPVVPFVSGTVKAYPIKPGTEVKKGDLIAKIEDDPYRQQFLQAQAGYLAVEGAYARVETLYREGATTKQNYEEVKAQHDATKAQYDLAKIQLDYTNVRAPADGTVIMAPSAVGSIGSNTQPIAVIADLSKLVVRLKVPEKYFDLFNMDPDSVSAEIIRPGLEDYSKASVCHAKLETITPFIQPDSKTFEVLFTLQDNLENFTPGMYVEVSVTYASKDDVLTLPLKVLKTDGTCYTYDPKSQTVSWMDVSSAIHDDNYFAVSDKDDKDYSNVYFVISGQNSVFDGQKVVAREPGKNTQEQLIAPSENIQSDENSTETSQTEPLNEEKEKD